MEKTQMLFNELLEAIYVNVASYIEKNKDKLKTMNQSQIVKELKEFNFTVSKKSSTKEPKPKRTVTKVNSSKQEWITFEEYNKRIKENPDKHICAYMPNRGEHKHNICAAIITDSTIKENVYDYRCSACKSKKGYIESYNKPKVTTKVEPGFNVPEEKPNKINLPIIEIPKSPIPIDEELTMFTTKNEPDVHFIQSDKYNNLPCILEDESFIVLGKLNLKITEETELPPNWKDKLVELNEEEKEYIKTLDSFEYRYKYDF
jgi:hypothetical protein